MTSFGERWPSACESPATDELLIDLAADQGVHLTGQQAEGLLQLVDGHVVDAVHLLDRMILAHLRRTS